MQDQAAQQVSKALKEANNVMVTVRNSPSVDELTAAVALTLMLNHMNKHATTVFSGLVPSTIEFLQPEMAIETNTDSLRDFIISLDKSKADKLRYKVEDNVVRIFITPYKTSISEQDLEFSQGDFNVDVVIALGVVGREDFDQAVTSHGRILHDATVVGVTNQQTVSQIGAINWHDPQASSISEMIASISEGLGPNVLDGQIATALMTGIVAETDRFRNNKTTPRVLSLSSLLMASGANQQLIAEQLEQTPPVNPLVPEDESAKDPNGMLAIEHAEMREDEVQNIHIDDHGNLDIKKSYAPGPGISPPQEITSAPVGNSSLGSDFGVPEPETPMSQQLSPPPPLVSEPEPEASEVPPREYISEPAKTAEADKEPSGGGVTTGLFSNQTETKEPSSSLDPSSVNEKTLEHRHKVINPIEHSEPEKTEKLEGISASLPGGQPPKTVREMISPGAPKNVEPTATPVVDNQTLTELEKVVEGTANTNLSTGTNLEDYTGSIRTPAAPEKVDTETEEDKVAELIANKVEEAKEAPKKEPEPKAEPPKIPEPPKIVSPNSAPSVPPPIVPQDPTQPQFYEADGSKSEASLKPTDK